ncbi:MAG: carboxymuconolactone decarboxylase family protein [Devosia sp.]
MTSREDGPSIDRPVSEAFDRGLQTRKQVLGEEYVARSIGNAGEFDWPMQTTVTEWCWDATWNRDGLDRRARSILNLGMIAALNRPQEFKAHVRGAVNNGLTPGEIREICLQIATYCGMPAGLDAFRLAKDVLTEMGQL